LAGACLLTVGIACVSGISRADEIDDLLTKRQNNFAHVKKYKAEYIVETERPDAPQTSNLPKKRMRYVYTLTRRDRNHPDPLRRFDLDMDIQEPARMHFRIVDGQFSILMASGKWVPKNLPDSAKQFLNDLPERNATDVPSQRNLYDVKRHKEKDSFWGNRKGLEFVPKGRAKLYARRVESVDADTGQAMDTELYDDSGKKTLHIKINKMGKHNGVFIAEDMDSEAPDVPGVGRVIRKTKVEKIEVDTE